jgi:uncharacterized spore protein YtfJ
MAVHEIFKSITERLGGAATVDTVFGAPHVLHNRAIIPVALVIGGFAAGGAESAPPPKEEAESHRTCGGGTGGFVVRPLAFIDVSDEGAKLVPIIDTTKLLLASLGLLGGTLVLVSRLMRRKR